MAKKNNANATTGTKASKKAAATEVVENVEATVEPTEEVVLDAKSDITAVEETLPEGTVKCSTCQIPKEQTEENFSPMAKGGFRNICKPCQTQASLAWTTKRADYRKQYQRANQLINLGIPAIVPNAKDWKQGDVIMTVEYTRDGVTYPSRPAEDVYAEMKAAQREAREAIKAQRSEEAAELKAQRAEARAAAREQRDAERAEAKSQRDAERAEQKRIRDAERAEQAEAARIQREKDNLAKAEARQKAAAEKAEQARIAREEREAAKAEARKQKALDAAAAAEAKAEARRQAAVDKAQAAVA